MPALRAKSQSYSTGEDTYLCNYREWRSGRVSESWAQFIARYKKKFWINPHSSASLYQRAQRLSGHRHQTLARDEELMRHMHKIRTSSILWTWGKIAQAFGTNAKTVSRAYKSFLERHGINEVENESARIRWTKFEVRRLYRARHFGYSWERIAKKFGYEEYICISAHYIYSYGQSRSGNFNPSFHPKCFLFQKDKTSMYHIRKSSSTQEIKDEHAEGQCQWEDTAVTQDRKGPVSHKSYHQRANSSGGSSSQSDLSAVECIMRKTTTGSVHNHERMNHGPTENKQPSRARSGVTTAATPRNGTRADKSAIITTPMFKRRVVGKRINEARASSRSSQAYNTRPSGTSHRSELSPKYIVNSDTRLDSRLLATVLDGRQISKYCFNTNTKPSVVCFRVKSEPEDDKKKDKSTRGHMTSRERQS
ncbi:hypothetical protein SBOR_9658 [Sclerotinia borealis F-4128]|uniref:Uncharacterized protein n=1 Tax=Sclerotinia borealis (strain F-4128) TaxID=1432307 RepID=W9C4W6_SCLBF|nr:hypothetical protein SBOR_9658 [Sclerotinia borealis F-4128]